MRVSHGLSIAALVLIPIMAGAQTANAPEVAALGTGPNGGSIDFGLRGTSVRGEPARYERHHPAVRLAIHPKPAKKRTVTNSRGTRCGTRFPCC
jgi:hypothetical protein